MIAAHALVKVLDRRRDVRDVELPEIVVGPQIDVGEWVRIVGKPGVDAQPVSSDGRQRVAAVGQGPHVEHPRHRAHVVPDVAATDLAAASDHHHAELGDVGIVGEDVVHQLAVARLEHVERQHAAGQERRAKWEHRHHAHRRIVRVAERQLGSKRARSGSTTTG